MDRVGYGVGAAAACGESRRKSAWITRPDVEFLNSLHPRGGIEFPALDGFIGDRHQLEEAFKIGFRAVKDRWEAKMLKSISQLNQSELKIYWAIKSRTLDFGKIFEKIPERHFRYGLCDDDGSLKIGSSGYPIFPPVGIDDHGNLNRAIKGLIRKKAVSRFKSDKHPQHGESYIYTPMDIREVWQCFILTTPATFVGRDADFKQIEWDSFKEILRTRAKRLIDEVNLGATRSADPLERNPSAGDHSVRTASEAQREISRPTVRKRVRI